LELIDLDMSGEDAVKAPAFIAVILVFPVLLACGSGDSGQVGESAAAAPDSAVTKQEPVAVVEPAPRRPAQRAWDTADSGSFDVEELNRKRAESLLPAPKRIDTLKIKPSEHPALPANIASWLEVRGYIIPQTMFKYNSNVFHGEFMGKGNRDIGVLALRNSVLDVLVFEKCTTDDVHTLVQDVPGVWGLELLYHSVPDSTVRLLYGIETFGVDLMQYFYEAYYWPEPPEIAHEALKFYFRDDSSTIFYFHKGKWLKVNKRE